MTVMFVFIRAKSQQHNDITPIVDAEDGMPFGSEQREPEKFNIEEKL